MQQRTMKKPRPESLSDPLLPPISKDAEKGASPEEPEKKPGGWRCMPFIIGNEAFEKLASFGLTANLTVYLVEHFRMEEVAVASLGNVFNGTSNFTPLLGAFIADACWGRFRTLAWGSVLSFLGMVAWTLTSLVPPIWPSSCDQVALQSGQCMGPTKIQLGFLFFSMGLLAIGSGGVRPCSLPFGVDQFDCTTEQGHRGMNSFFNWYYCITTATVMISMTAVVYIQDNLGWLVGFGIPTCLMLLSIIIFFVGARLYVYVPPEGSVYSGIAQVFVASFRKRSLKLPSQKGMEQQDLLLYDPPITNNRIMKLPLSQQYRFLNKAAIRCEGELSPDGSPTNPWRLCSIQQIEELKCLIRIMPIWASGIFCFLAVTQQWSFVVLQSMKMDRRLGSHFRIPPGSMASIGMFALVVFIPIYDQIIVPMLRRMTKLEGGITLLQRQGVGMVISILSMVVAAVVEKTRRDSALAQGGLSPLSVLWLVPQLVLMGVAEALNAVGQIEFFNRQFPDRLQTLAASLLSLSQAGASYITSVLVAIIQKSTGGGGRTSWLDNDINNGRLDYYYYVIAAMGVMNLLCFLPCAHFYRHKGT